MRILIIVYTLSFIITIIVSKTPYTHEILYISPFYRLFDFFIGMLIGLIFIEKKERLENSHKIRYCGMLQFAACVLLIFMISIWKKIPIYYGYSVAYTLVIGLFIYFFAFDRGLPAEFLGKSFFSFFSKISFEMFMIHQIIIRYLDEINCQAFYLSNKLYIMLTIILTVGGGYMLHKLSVKKPQFGFLRF